MEEVMNWIMHAFELSKKFEQELPNMANHPQMLLSSINDVEKAFSIAKEKLMMILSSSSSQQDDMTKTSNPFAQILSHNVFMQKNPHAHSLDELLMQQTFDLNVLFENKMISGGGVGGGGGGGGDIHELLRSRGTLRIGEGGTDLESLEILKGLEGDQMQGIDAPPSRPKKRNNDLEKKTKMFPAPQIGNTEMPPDDGFTWRKYGQKEILGRKHPRSYYMCTHQKLYLCPAKKQVQRLDDNPNIVEVTYRGEHICHKTSTAPSSYPPPPPQFLINISTTTPQTNISSQLTPSLNLRWPPGTNLDLRGGVESGEPSTSRFDVVYPVTDMADAMFNSGSSSGNSMDSLFNSSEDKRELDGKKS